MELQGDPRLAGASEDIRRLRRIAGEMAGYRPSASGPPGLPPVVYESVLGFLAEPRIKSLPPPKATFLFDGMLVALDGEDEAPAEDVPVPRPADMAALLRPSARNIITLIDSALQAPAAYPLSAPVRPVPLRAPDYGRIPGEFRVAQPEYPLAESRGPLKALDGLVRWSNKDRLRDYEESLQVWEEARREFEEALSDVQVAERELRAHLDDVNAGQQAAFDTLLADYEAGRAAWEAAAEEEARYLQELLESLQLAYLDDPVELARLVLSLTPLPGWLPEQVSGTFDASGVLTIDHDFPDDRHNQWGANAEPGLPALVDPRLLGEIFYPAIALRCAYEIGRNANQNIVTDIVFNGWVTRIDTITGRLARVCVASLAADLERILRLDFRAINVADAFASLRGRTVRAQTMDQAKPYSVEELEQIYAEEAAEAELRHQQAEAERQRQLEAAEAERQRQREAAEAELLRQRQVAIEAELRRQRQAAAPEPPPAPPAPPVKAPGRKSKATAAAEPPAAADPPAIPAPPPVPQSESVALVDEARFEQMCRELVAKEFSANGEDVSISSAPGDHGFLAVIIDRHPLKGGKLVVQTRWSDEATRVSAIRELFGAIVSEGAVKGIHISPGTYSREAQDFAAGKPITLIGGTELLALLATDAATGKAAPQLRLVFNSGPQNSRSA